MAETLCKTETLAAAGGEAPSTAGKGSIPHGYVEMTFVKETATGRGRNEKFIMEDMGNGTMKITEGRVGITVGRYKPRVSYRPVSEWDMVYGARAARGYLATSTHKMDKVEVKKGKADGGLDYAPVEDAKVQAIIEELARYQKQMFDASYTVRVDNISDEMIALGGKILKELASGYAGMSLAEFNNKLKLLFAVIPRRMDKLSEHLAKHKADFAGIVVGEQDLFDIMVSQVRSEGGPKTCGKTILEANGMEMRQVTDDEEAYIRKLLGDNAGKYIEAYRVVNRATEKDFGDFAELFGLEDGDGIEHLFHGTRNENVWSILTTGLKNRPPKDAVITGKAYGMGTYFAPDAIKSLGYTSRIGSKWANGTCSCGFLLICKVAVGPEGTRYDGHFGCDTSLNAAKLEQIAPGALCTWAKSRYSGFRMDEVIVYQDSQSTVEYIVKMG
ncbi:MAG: hypothetical protein NC489_37960 [Ruminococcus flavefaciens]|nr:hypothetical protein [Ruminococcus flavefaciens]